MRAAVEGMSSYCAESGFRFAAKGGGHGISRGIMVTPAK